MLWILYFYLLPHSYQFLLSFLIIFLKIWFFFFSTYIIVSSAHNINIASFLVYLVFLCYFLFEIIRLLMSFFNLIALVSTLDLLFLAFHHINFDDFFFPSKALSAFMEMIIWFIFFNLVNYTDRLLNINSLLHFLFGHCVSLNSVC